MFGQPGYKLTSRSVPPRGERRPAEWSRSGGPARYAARQSGSRQSTRSVSLPPSSAGGWRPRPRTRAVAGSQRPGRTARRRQLTITAGPMSAARTSWSPVGLHHARCVCDSRGPCILGSTTIASGRSVSDGGAAVSGSGTGIRSTDRACACSAITRLEDEAIRYAGHPCPRAGLRRRRVDRVPVASTKWPVDGPDRRSAVTFVDPFADPR